MMSVILWYSEIARAGSSLWQRVWLHAGCTVISGNHVENAMRTLPRSAWLRKYSTAQEMCTMYCMCKRGFGSLAFWIPYDVTHCLGMHSSLKCIGK